tara:strand:- start:2238 stop:2369 length:132 start_codon:yes stop_codon:yes gene_type:complete
MAQVIVTVEDREQVEAILAALAEAEEQGGIDFAFNVQTTDGEA